MMSIETLMQDLITFSHNPSQHLGGPLNDHLRISELDESYSAQWNTDGWLIDMTQVGPMQQIDWTNAEALSAKYRPSLCVQRNGHDEVIHAVLTAEPVEPKQDIHRYVIQHTPLEQSRLYAIDVRDRMVYTFNDQALQTALQEIRETIPPAILATTPAVALF